MYQYLTPHSPHQNSIEKKWAQVEVVMYCIGGQSPSALMACYSRSSVSFGTIPKSDTGGLGSTEQSKLLALFLAFAAASLA